MATMSESGEFIGREGKKQKAEGGRQEEKS